MIDYSIYLQKKDYTETTAENYIKQAQLFIHLNKC